MKIVHYSRLNTKNKARVDLATDQFPTKPAIVHHSAMSTHCTKFVRSIITVCDPAPEVALVLGGKLKQTQIAVDK